MKKIALIIPVLILSLTVLCSCGNGKSPLADDGGITIVTTIFPEYDWVMNVLGDNPAGANVTLLLDNGVDLHSYQPAASDILKISACDMFVYVGGESDQWVEDALGEALNKHMKVINLLDILGDQAKEEETVYGMQGSEEEEEEEAEYDEHVWLSLRNASTYVRSIAEALGEMDPDNAKVYEANAGSYIGKLTEMDVKYESAVSGAKVSALLFGDRFPFRYLVDDYGLDYYAAFAGCTAETEASFETITKLANKVDELSLDVVMTTEATDGRIAETIVQNTKDKDQKILALDSMQSVRKEDIEGGTTYLSIMEDNLSVLTEALGSFK